MATPKSFDDWSFSDAETLLTSKRRCVDAENRRLFYNGDHWQGGSGFIGQKPENDARKLSEIEAGFQWENVIAEIVDRHVSGILGREPMWDYVPKGIPSANDQRRQRARLALRRQLTGAALPPPPPPQVPSPQFPSPAPAPRPQTPPPGTLPAEPENVREACDAVTNWWDEYEMLQTVLEPLTETILIEERAVLRIYLPGEASDRSEAQDQADAPTDGASNLTPADLSEALDRIRVEVLTADRAGVFIDKWSGKKIGLCRYKHEEREFIEMSYLDENGDTVLRVVDQSGATVQRSDPPFKLGGALLVHEVKRRPLVTNAIIRNNKALNLALTMMQRNVNLAGSRERVFFNAQRPGKWVDEAGRDWIEGVSTGNKTFQESKYQLGPGVTYFAKGEEIYDETGAFKGYANPNLNVTDPVAVTSFTDTRGQYYASILGQAQQKHVLISDSATASGLSRQEARAEYSKSLKKTKTPLDGSGRWILGTVLALASDLCERGGEFEDLRAEFNTIVDAGPASPEERNTNRADMTAGVLSKETTMSRADVDDTDAESMRIAEEKASMPQTQPPPSQTNNNSGGANPA
jgi:hypothetical protein